MFGYGKSNHNHKTDGQTTANLDYVLITYTSGVWKLDDSQWKLDTNHPKLVEGSIDMYHWEISCLVMVKTVTSTHHCKFIIGYV